MLESCSLKPPRQLTSAGNVKDLFHQRIKTALGSLEDPSLDDLSANAQTHAPRHSKIG